jgi:hypothetical protein
MVGEDKLLRNGTAFVEDPNARSKRNNGLFDATLDLLDKRKKKGVTVVNRTFRSVAKSLI